MDTYRKTNDDKLEVTSTTLPVLPQVVVVVTEYNLDFLEKQKIDVAADLDNIIARHKKELEVAQANVDEVNTLLLEANKLFVQ